tara:strand:+ start:212 stop:613 length:402 start_codon:yes stop_codon:yes gene_type:complete
MAEDTESLEPPTHYKIAENKQNGMPNIDYILIEYNKIILDKSMSEELTRLCGDKYNGTGLKKFRDFKTKNYGDMKRIDIVKNDFENDKGLDPIKVINFNGRDNRYEIIDGRHRYIISLYKGYTHIPCNLLEEL